MQHNDPLIFPENNMTSCISSFREGLPYHFMLHKRNSLWDSIRSIEIISGATPGVVHSMILANIPEIVPTEILGTIPGTLPTMILGTISGAIPSIITGSIIEQPIWPFLQYYGGTLPAIPAVQTYDLPGTVQRIRYQRHRINRLLNR